MSRWIFGLALAALVGTGCTAPGSATAAEANARLAPLLGASDWIGAQPSAATLKGKVVVLDVFTVDCWNCQNVIPMLRSLDAADSARGLAIVGIHSPETPPERDRSYVDASLRRQEISWPIAVDNDFTLWKDYGVNAWPTELFFDRHGRWRATIVGDQQDEQVKATVEKLLAER